jgi:hypothetical protein
MVGGHWHSRADGGILAVTPDDCRSLAEGTEGLLLAGLGSSDVSTAVIGPSRVIDGGNRWIAGVRGATLTGIPSVRAIRPLQISLTAA